MSTLSVIGVFREGDTFILVDANQDQYECTSPEALWADLMAITSDPSLPKTELSGAQVAGEVDILDDTCSRLNDILSERHGLLIGHVGSEAVRRIAPSLIKGLRRRAAARRGKRSG